MDYQYSQIEFCIFGKALPDFYFYKEGKHVQGVLVIPQDDDEEAEDKNKLNHLTGGTTKFKMDHSDIFWPQTFADMTRIANLLVVQSLEHGHLVASVQVMDC